jgi:2-methylcitrate dehydratase PrpD
MTVLERLAEIIRRPGLSAPAHELLRRHVADIAGAWLAGSAIPEGQAVTQYLSGESLPEKLAANIAAARASEIDDIHLPSLTTPGAAIVVSALTLAASLENVSPEDLADAVAAGYEALIRLGLTIDGATVSSRGIWPTYFAAPFGVAVVAARLLKLSPTQTAHALAMTITMASPNAGHQHGPLTSRWLAFGLAAKNGFLAAQAAQAGFLADPDILESPFLNAAYGIKPDLTAFAAGLGTQLCVNDLSFKPWCAARQTMAGAQAMRELIAEGVSPWEITKAEIAIPPLHVKMVDHGVHAGDRTSHLTSLPYQIALAALSPDSAMDVAQTPATTPGPLAALMAKIAVRGDDAFLAAYPKAWHARLTLHTAKGTHERTVMAVPGDPPRAFDDAQTRQKFLRLAIPVLGETKANETLAIVWNVLNKPENAKTLLNTTAQAQKRKSGL